jgi:DNA polymerase-3 subunit alpha
LKEYEEKLAKVVTLYSRDIRSDARTGESDQLAERQTGLIDGRQVTVGGIITGKKVKTTKNDNLMAFVEIEDLYGSMEIIVFPSTLKQYADLLVEESIVIVTGRVSMREEEEAKIVCNEVKPLRVYREANTSENKPAAGKSPVLYLRVTGYEEEAFMKSLMSLLQYFRGNTPVVLYDSRSKNYNKLDMSDWVNSNVSRLIDELEERLGSDNVKLKA